MKVHYSFFLFLFIPFFLTAQNKRPKYKFKNEVTVDVTAVLGKVLSLNSTAAKSPYGFGYRRHFSKYSFRLNGNALMESDTESQFIDDTFVDRISKTHDHSLRLGLEKGIVVAKNFNLLYGFDVLAGYQNVLTEIEDEFTRVNQKFIFGLGPALRIEYQISERFFLTTESTFYGRLIMEEDSFKLNQSPSVVTSNSDYDIKMALPTSLTFSIGF